MKLTFLGTGTSQGVPVITCRCPVCTSTDPADTRLRTSALIETDSHCNILIDIGPDFRQQMLTHSVPRLDAILLTHAHRDHVAGLDDIRAYNYTQCQPMQLYCNPQAEATLRRDYAYIFSPHPYPGLPEVVLHTVSDAAPFTAAGETIVPIPAFHKDLPVLGFRIGTIAYITDANHLPEESLALLHDLDILVLNALRLQPHPSHFCLPQALYLIGDLRPRQAYITHISHEMGLARDIARQLPANVALAHDGLEVNL